MGCDIHCYIEYKEFDRWWSFGSRINPGRDYRIFAKLAGVRSEAITRMIPLRGFPGDSSWEVMTENYCRIVDEETDSENTCSMTSAQKWAASYGCKFRSQGDHENFWIEHPDWHHHSWVTPTELEFVLNSIDKDSRNGIYGVSPGYYALLNAAKAFVDSGLESRIVFWFDN